MIPNARNTYLNASVSTASSASLLVMLYERLVLDLQRAATALQTGERSVAHEQLLHAQEIVLELRSSLKPEAWSGGPALGALYDYLHTELVRANMGKDLEITTFCLHVVSQLRDAWRDAAMATVSASA
ncbi:flagellar export chaperone FliS [Nocardioides pacificus]